MQYIFFYGAHIQRRDIIKKQRLNLVT